MLKTMFERILSFIIQGSCGQYAMASVKSVVGLPTLSYDICGSLICPLIRSISPRRASNSDDFPEPLGPQTIFKDSGLNCMFRFFNRNGLLLNETSSSGMSVPPLLSGSYACVAGIDTLVGQESVASSKTK